jgi:RNAse (barnase) inhibitor barstar
MKVRRGTERDVQMAHHLSAIPVGYGLPHVEDLEKELDQMVDVLLGRVESPIDSPYLALQEVATAYFARAQEIDMLIHRAEHEGIALRGSAHYKFRTGELRAFIDLARRCAELGSRRLSQEQLLTQQRLDNY